MTIAVGDYVGPDASKVESRPPTVAHAFLDRIAATPEREAFRYPTGDDSTGGWLSVTWREVGERVRKLSAGLIALGVEPEQRVAVYGSTTYEWILADLATMCAGAATTTVYPASVASEVAFIVSDAECQVVFAEDDDQLKKLAEKRSEMPTVKAIVTFNGTPDEANNVLSLADLEAKGAAYLEDHPDAIDKAVAAIGPESLATLIYTSGTTGRPKGVRLAHDCWTYEGAAIEALGILNIDDLQFLWLPLAHSFGKVLQVAQLVIGFSTAVDGRVDKIVENLGIVKPTFMGAAPRIFEKAHGRIVTMMEEEGGVKEKLFHWAFGVGRKVSQLRQAGREPSGALAIQYKLADRLVLSKIRARFGGRQRFFVSGAAALNRDIAEWFHAAGILIVEGYGLTETSAASFVNLPGRFRFGTVGPVVPGTEVKIAEDGEVLVRGPGVMRGYHNLPELTAEVLDSEGWFHTGDIGELEDGLLRITDRKKDLFKTSGGKYVAPALIESSFKALCPYASNVLVYGSERNFVSALVTLDPDAIVAWAEQNEVSGSYDEIVTSTAAQEMVQGYVDQLNAKLNRWETVKKFAILDHDLTVENGGITPSLKLKRKAVEKKYSDVLDGFYPK
ncbi:AMP-dependent synthetase/ligase [Tenggerimyces flavus]|uniref:AMP-dependent synthetase/ligase n=1 Tax=Tenggerimyces flavus TaxID=1708749 RepID=A0ABV7YG11_9ACTN|nr:long-chain fatty acid--CoA ligase [Tenggerimyces flavus]MBM7789262.1 long-chain acyl-CoA synthetase [Tenggerimyces flavus]